MSAADAVSLVTSGMRVFVHGAAATPTPLLEALGARRDLADVRLYHLHVDGPAPWTAPECADCFRSVSFFNVPGKCGRPWRTGGRISSRSFLSDIPGLFSSGRLPLDRLDAQIATDRPLHEHHSESETPEVGRNGDTQALRLRGRHPQVEFHGGDRTNDTAIIPANPRVTAINSAIQIDLTGQVCADSMGHHIYSGIGGQMDFIRGAARSRAGSRSSPYPRPRSKVRYRG
ncbi:hypothetical protein BH23GEM2_BH23GEM2_06550 [soil metagenome]